MATQNLKQAMVVYEDLGAGQGNTQTILTPQVATQTPATGAPVIVSNSFTVPQGVVGATTSPSWFVPTGNVAAPQPLLGSDTFFVNRSRYCYLTLVCSMYVVPGSTATTQVYLPIAPLDVMFVPASITVLQAVLGGVAYDSTQPIPTSGAQVLTLDQFVGQ